MNTQLKLKKFDLEWMSLIVEAKKMGLSREDVRVFIRKRTEKISS